MKKGIVTSSMVLESTRIDPKHFLDDGYQCYLRVTRGSWPFVTVSQMLGESSVWAPSVSKFVPAAGPDFGKPYLAPFDTLRYVLVSNSWVSSSHFKAFSSCEVKRGQLLITCSGRNLGPCVWVDDLLSEFVVSGDMIRVEGADQSMLFYLMAFLHTRVGNALIRRHKTGSVIDHISPRAVQDLVVPILADDFIAQIVTQFEKATLMREHARHMLAGAMDAFSNRVGIDQALSRIREMHLPRHFSLHSGTVRSRIDAEYHAPIYRAFINELGRTCELRQLGDIADITRPPGRYKTLYVTDNRYGLPLLSTRHMAQFRPVGLKYISPLAFRTPEEYLVRAGCILMAADGRAEENLGDCVLLGQDRDGWAASGHVIRVKPRADIHPGILYLSLVCEPIRAIIKSLATGSVVDAISEMELATVYVPYLPLHEARQIGDQVVGAWEEFAQAKAVEDAAIAIFEDALFTPALGPSGAVGTKNDPNRGTSRP